MTDCTCSNTEIRARAIRGGSMQHVRQCLDCGKPSNPVKQTGVAPAFDESLRKRFIEGAVAKRASDRANEKAQWDVAYADYLASTAWAALRSRVLERDDNWCQGCLDAPADVVHHHTYAHMGCEFAFELVSLCNPCHTRFHISEGSHVE